MAIKKTETIQTSPIFRDYRRHCILVKYPQTKFGMPPLMRDIVTNVKQMLISFALSLAGVSFRIIYYIIFLIYQAPPFRKDLITSHGK